MVEGVLTKVLLPLIAGGIGWFVTQYVVGPWLAVQQARQRTHESVIFFANVFCNLPEGSPVPDPDREHHKRAVEEIRRRASELGALNHSLWGVHKRLLRRKGIDLDKATSALIGLSNSTSELALITQHKVERSLSLPLSLSTDVVEETYQLWLRKKR